ncbi:NAD(P)-dependent oxidoreductase [Candidatus Shapirobacteria bacterium]|nr:NAD(P)-dependent oxidoreductase [Candidatus Shapirobacteria bacterium]
MGKIKIIGTGLSGLVGSRIGEILRGTYSFVDFSLETGVDILDIKSLEKQFLENKEAKALIHLAAFTDTNAAWQERGDKNGLCYRLNVLGTKNIIKLCQEYGQYLIYVSTDFVFSGKKEGVYTEKDTPDPIEWYGQTKRWAEETVLESGLAAAIIRLSYPFRASFPGKKDLVRKIIEGLREKTLYPLFADQVITPTFIDDFADGIDYFLKEKPTGIFHLVGESHLSPYGVGKEVARTFGFDPKLVKKGSLRDYERNAPPGSRPFQKNLALDNQKITSLGIKMLPFAAALKKVRKQLS